MSRLLRFNVIASFLGILLAAGAMAALYRAATIQTIVALAEKHNLAMAQSAFNPDRSALAGFLSAAAADNDAKSVPLPAALDQAMSGLVRDSSVAGIKIYSRKGLVSASTSPSQIGANKADNPGFTSAMSGEVLAKLVSRRAPNRPEDTTVDDNLVETYIPVRLYPSEPILGVIEINTDVSALVDQAERTAITIFAITVVILAGIGATFLMVVRRPRYIVDGPQQTTPEKTALLELLSERSLRREELERKKLAGDLHEGLAQSLSAIKVAVETAKAGATDSARSQEFLKPVVSDLQGAIQRVRSMAMNLRPSGLDDFGLFATIKTLCHEFGDMYPGIGITQKISGRESLIPAPLKIVIFRNIEAALKIIGEQAVASEVRVTLQIRVDSLTLAIADNTTGAIPPAEFISLDVNTESPFSPIRERTVISGGQLTIARNKAGAIELRATWARPARARLKWKW